MVDESTQFVLGDAATDALTEGRRGFLRRRKKKPAGRLTHCENCAAPLSGEYCAVCGQHAIDYRRSLLRVLIDAADSFLNWDTKFVKSLGVLLARPWRLTNDFNAGRRARYVNPLRLYLLASIAFFLMAKLLNLTPSKPIELTAQDRAEIDAAVTKLTASDSVLSPEQRAKVDALRAKFLGTDTPLSEKERVQVDRVIAKLPRYAEKEQLRPKDLQKLDALLARIPEPPLPTEAANPELAGTPPLAPSQPPPPPIPGTSPSNRIVVFDGPEGNNSAFGRWIQDKVKQKVGEDGTNA